MATALLDAERAILAPPARLTLAEWAEAHRVLDSRTCAEPGPFRLSRTPYWRGPMAAFDSPVVQQITIKTSTQVGKTTFEENIIGYTIDQRPRPTLLVMPRKEDAFDLSRDRLQPLFGCCPVLRRRRPVMSKDFTQRVYRMPHMVLHLAWAGSPAALASKAVGLVILDEVALYPKYAKVNADPVELARERTRTFADRKIVLTSTPQDEGNLIELEFDRSDARFYYLPCPGCGRYQLLEWEQLKMPQEAEAREVLRTDWRAHPELAWYECRACGKRIADDQKAGLLARGIWAREDAPLDDLPRALAGGAGPLLEPCTPHMGFHLWAAYSPWLTFAEIAAKYIDAFGDREKFHTFWCLWLARPWQEKGESPEPSVLRGCLDQDHHQGRVPDRALVLTAGVDVHKRSLYVIIRAWGLDGRSWLVWHAELGRPGGKASALAPLLDTVLLGVYDGWQVAQTFIDSAWDTECVYLYCMMHPHTVAAVKGASTRDSPALRAVPIEKLPSGQPAVGGALLYLVNRWHWNPVLFDHVRVPGGAPGEWRVYGEVEQDVQYQRQVLNQAAFKRMRHGHEVLEWKPKALVPPSPSEAEPDEPLRRDDHYFDCEVYAMAAAWSPRIAIQRYRAAPQKIPVVPGEGFALELERGPFRRSY